MPKQFSLPKISLILQKMRIGAKKFLNYNFQILISLQVLILTLKPELEVLFTHTLKV